MVKLSDEDRADFAVLRDAAMAIIFGFYIRGTHWRHLANTTEPSICGGDAALCQITLTTCLITLQACVSVCLSPHFHTTARTQM